MNDESSLKVRVLPKRIHGVVFERLRQERGVLSVGFWRVLVRRGWVVAERGNLLGEVGFNLETSKRDRLRTGGRDNRIAG